MNAESTYVRPSRPSVVAPGGDGARLAALVLALPLRLAATPFGRRALAAVTIAVVLVSIVGVLYDHADQPRSAAVLAGTRAPASRAAAERRSAPSAAAARRSKAAGEAAVAWFADRQRIAVDRVRALQQQRVNATERRVLVVADAGGAKLPSAYVTVRKGPGGWAAVS
jgi:hypothetical protein